MEVAQIIFYFLAAVIFGTAVLAVSCRQALHGALSLILSLLALAALFYLLGAPLLAALEVLLYAGAIMMLLLFVIMMLPKENAAKLNHSSFRVIPLGLCLIAGLNLWILLARWPGASTMLLPAMLSPASFGQVLFDKFWLAVELVSLLLFVALVGALFFGAGEIGPENCPRTTGDGK